MRFYGALNLGFAALYASFGFVLTPSRSRAFNGALALVCALLVASGVGLIAGTRWAKRAAVAACGVLLGFAGVVVLLLVASSAYLQSIYGALGQGLALVTLCVALLVVEAFALLPLFELRFLLRRDRA